jgi:sorting nexin-29
MWTTKYAPGMEYRNNMPDIQQRDKLECNNYRGITLLNNAYKIFSSILNERLKITTEKIIGEYQCGFCRNKSTIDQLLILRQTTEKHNEHGLDLHMLFIDFKEAFDSINRKRLFEAMDKVGIPQKLIRLIRMTMCETKARVKIDSQTSAPFEFNNGVKQGDGLSTTLFILAIHNTAQEIDQRHNLYKVKPNLCTCL